VRGRATVLLLLAAATAAGAPAEALVRRLGDRDPLRRRIATSRLLEMGPEAWPALEPAARSDDPEVASRARRILQAWAWIPPRLRDVLDADRRRALLGADPAARLRVADALRKDGGDAGREALAYLFAARPATFRIEEEAPRRTYFDLAPEVVYRVRNVSRHPGWAPPRLGVPEVVQWRPFGRPVTFPERAEGRVMRGRFRSKSGATVVARTTFVERTEWVAPGATARERQRVGLVGPGPGVATFAVGQIPRSHRSGQALPHMEGLRLVAIGNALPFDIPLDLVARRFTYNLLGDDAMWGVAIDGARVEARREDDRLVVRLASDFAARAPADFGSVWFVALDERGEVVADGPLDGGDTEPRTYAAADLVPVPRPPAALERAFPLPAAGPKAVRLVIGAAFSRGRRAAGYTAIAKPIDLP
jgi:hypothetical protein